MKKCKYERLDELLKEFKPYELADYIFMNDEHYAEQIRFYIESSIAEADNKEDDRQSHIDYDIQITKD